MKFDNDLDLLEWMKNNLYTAVACDALDQLGIYDRAMDGGIRPGELLFADIDGIVVVPKDVIETMSEISSTLSLSRQESLAEGPVAVVISVTDASAMISGSSQQST